MVPIWIDLRFALRTLIKNRGFTAVGVLILALAIGVNTATFSALNAWFFRPLPFPDPGRIVVVLQTEEKRRTQPPTFDSFVDLLNWKSATNAFSSMAGAFWRTYTLSGRGEPRRLLGMIVTSDLFPTLGVGAKLGRTFSASDLSGPPVAVLSYRLWQEGFSGSSDIVGKSVILNGKSFIVLGVMPASFDFRLSNQPRPTELWTLIPPGDLNYGPNGQGPIAVIARLRGGVSIRSAQLELSELQRRLDRKSRSDSDGYGIVVDTLQRNNTQSVRLSLFLLSGTAFLVLLIGCANLAALQISRSAERAKELAIRSALGASRSRLLSQVLAESAILALGGTGFGILLAEACVFIFGSANLLGAQAPNPITVDWRTVVFAACLMVITSVLFGLPSAFLVSRLDLNRLLKEEVAPVLFRSPRARRVVVIGQVAIALVLATAATQLTRTLVALFDQSPGFEPRNVTAMYVALDNSLSVSTEKRNEFTSDLLRHLRSLPGVSYACASASDVVQAPVPAAIRVEGRPQRSVGDELSVGEQMISPGYFVTLGIPLLRGRYFRGAANSAPVVILNESAAKLIDEQNPIGTKVQIGGGGPWRSIIGVVGDTRSLVYGSLGWRVVPRAFVPIDQATSDDVNPIGSEMIVYLLRKSPVSANVLKNAVFSIDPNVPVSVHSLGQVIAQNLLQPRQRAMAVVGFAGLGLFLAAIGVYGLVSQIVSQRTHEIAVRIAIGARPKDVARIVIRKGILPVLVGIATGILVCLAVSRSVASIIYGIKPTDALAILGVALLLLITGLAASYFPVRRAMSVDPASALRHQ